MFRRVSCPLMSDDAEVALKAIRNAAVGLSLEIPVEVRFLPKSSDYNDGLAIVIDTKASREAFLVAEAIAMTVYDSVWWSSESFDNEREIAEVKKALENI